MEWGMTRENDVFCEETNRPFMKEALDSKVEEMSQTQTQSLATNCVTLNNQNGI